MTNPLSTPFTERTLGELVRDDSRAAEVFERFGLDFCCGGRQTLGDAARARQVSIDAVVDALSALADEAETRPDDDWRDLDALARHIVERHHAYVRSASPTIAAWLGRLVERHGARHPELRDVQRTFAEVAHELDVHMMKEENILFPFISDLAAAARGGGLVPAGPFGSVQNPIRVMETDHALVGKLMGQLRAESHNLVPPDDACTTYRLCYEELGRFERDLHRHIFLEDHVLFRRALDLERDLA